MTDATDQFRKAIRSAGLIPPDVIEADGKLHRFSSNGKRGDDAGWYAFFGGNIPAGSFGDWRSGQSQKWQADIGRTVTPAEEAARRAGVEAIKREREAAKATEQAEAAGKAVAIWKAAAPAAEDHPYLVRKGVKPVSTLREIHADQAAKILGYQPQAKGERLSGRVLVVPVRIGDKVPTAELIDESGRKSAIAGGAKARGYWAAQPLPNGDGEGLTLLIGEGVATALSAKEASGYPAISALAAGNLPAVAKAMRERYPAAALVLLADLVKATGEPDSYALEAARAVGGLLAIPDFGADRPADKKDFNDMVALCGVEAVGHAIANASAPARAEHAPTCDSTVNLIRGSDLKPEPIGWLWAGWLARGKLHIIAGAPGTGKTTLALALAATVTTGGRWPDGTCAKAGNILIWSGEDDIRDTLLPRLLAMGTDRSRIYFVDNVLADGKTRPFDPARDMHALSQEAARIGNVCLLIVDPVVNVVSGDSHKNTEVRRSLQPLVDLAAQLGAAVLGVSHFSKGTAGRDPVERVTGSVAFGALPRVVFGTAKATDGESRTRRLFVRAKSNIGPDGGGFNYALEQVDVPDFPGLSASRVAWGQPLDGTALELLAVAEAVEDSEERGALTEATGWLSTLLAEEGTMDKREIIRLAGDNGFSKRTIYRARDKLGVHVATTGFGKDKRSVWSIVPIVPIVPTKNVGTIGTNEENVGTNGPADAEILTCLAAQGFRLSRAGDNLTDETRALIRAHKPELLAAPASDALPDPQAEARRQRVLAMLNECPDKRHALLTDTEADPEGVILTLAIRGIGTCDLAIPREKYDPFLLLDLIGRYGETMRAEGARPQGAQEKRKAHFAY